MTQKSDVNEKPNNHQSTNITEEQEQIHPVPKSLFDRAKALVEGIEVNLEEVLSDDEDNESIN